MSASWPVSFHQPRDRVALDPAPAVDQVLDRVGDLELAARRGLDRARRLEDRRREHVDADQRHVARRVLRLLDQPHDVGRRSARRRRSARGPAPCVSRISASGSFARKALDQVGDAVAQEVVAQVHHERRVAEELLGGEHRVRQPERASSCGM